MPTYVIVRQTKVLTDWELGTGQQQLSASEAVAITHHHLEGTRRPS